MTNLVALHLFNGSAMGTADAFGLAPAPKAPNVRLVTATKLVAPPNDIVSRILGVFLPHLDQLTDFATPLVGIGDKSYIMNATIALII
jgi:hypothetical protein